MYELSYLPGARKDLVELVRYISRSLKNPGAAERLAVELIEAAERIRAFPYANPVYVPIRPLSHEYRKVPVQNYLIFYWVDEENKQVTVARVLYGKRDCRNLVE